jgi:hypothetical protein
MTTAEVLKLIRKRYSGSEYALMEEVRNGAGFNANRSADAIVMNLWPSRGLEVIGMEVKTSRYDWMKELKSPAKAEAFVKYCDRWYLVAGDDTIVKKEELPSTWGLMIVKGGRLLTVVDAPKLQPIQMDKGFIACLLRRATEGLIHPDDIEDRIKTARENEREQYERMQRSNEDELQKIRKEINEFEQAAGIKIFERYNFDFRDKKKVGEAIKFIMDGGVEKLKKDLQSIQERSAFVKNNVDQAFELFKDELIVSPSASIHER